MRAGKIHDLYQVVFMNQLEEKIGMFDTSNLESAFEELPSVFKIKFMKKTEQDVPESLK